MTLTIGNVKTITLKYVKALWIFIEYFLLHIKAANFFLLDCFKLYRINVAEKITISSVLKSFYSISHCDTFNWIVHLR